MIEIPGRAATDIIQLPSFTYSSYSLASRKFVPFTSETGYGGFI